MTPMELTCVCVQGVPSGFSQTSRRTQLLQKKYIHGPFGFVSAQSDLNCLESLWTFTQWWYYKRLSLLVENIRWIFFFLHCMSWFSGSVGRFYKSHKWSNDAFKLSFVFASFCQNWRFLTLMPHLNHEFVLNAPAFLREFTVVSHPRTLAR